MCRIELARAELRPRPPRCIDYCCKYVTVGYAGKVALVTGGRIKIGYQIVLKLVRLGATVFATTRFPLDAAERYAREPDYEEWSDRLKV